MISESSDESGEEPVAENTSSPLAKHISETMKPLEEMASMTRPALAMADFLTTAAALRTKRGRER